jgi:hypothetical protein
MEVGDFQFVVAPRLERSLILERSVRGFVMDVVGTVKFFGPKLLRK